MQIYWKTRLTVKESEKKVILRVEKWDDVGQRK